MTDWQKEFDKFWRDIKGCNGCGNPLLVCKKDLHFRDFIKEQRAKVIDELVEKVKMKRPNILAGGEGTSAKTYYDDAIKNLEVIAEEIKNAK